MHSGWQSKGSRWLAVPAKRARLAVKIAAARTCQEGAPADGWDGMQITRKGPLAALITQAYPLAFKQIRP